VPVNSILIANRGEIAVRIIRACKLLGLRSIAVHSEADEGALWTRLADEARLIGPAPARDSYLSIDKLIAAALAAGADAIHPGYGLLSESPDFASAVEAAGLVFIGPSPRSIARMGDKVSARHAAVEAGVPVLPGSDGPVSDIGAALAVASKIGWPIAVKASFGGGGRGMRIARAEADLESAMAQAAREALAAFGRGEIYLERYLDRPRHVEVQILGDRLGHVVHLGDRDCSVQRRHQKLIEEAPAPDLSDALRTRIQTAAVDLAGKEAYLGAGTVEFLVDPRREEFFFLEMNTRLQVEHGVTEMVTGVDIVCQQIRIANGEPLDFTQADVRINGCAIQARIAAEDPWENFRPTPARLARLELPLGPWLRLDFGVEAGDVIPPHYDSMFGKVQAWGATREDARTRLGAALGALQVSGPASTAPFLQQVIAQPEFAAMAHDTASLESDWQPRLLADRPAAPSTAQPAATPAPANSAAALSRVVRVPWGGSHSAISIFRPASAADSSVQPTCADNGQAILSAHAQTGPRVMAPMDAAVAHVTASVGSKVARGETILVLEAMKMEVTISAPHDGTVTEVCVAAGEAVRSGALLAVVLAD
jgi:acetyl-CoA/propionyl-CoA carboxylase biotin carboxyl carrier protein